jgi:cysteine desulfurase
LRHVASVRASEALRVRALRDALAETLQRELPGVLINGSPADSLPHILNISIPDVQSEYVTLSLDHAGFDVSTKSACREGEESESHVVKALGGEPWRARNTLRISMGEETSARDITRFAATLASLV